MKTIRCFLAIDYAPEVKEKILQFVRLAQQTLPPRSVRWVSANNLHLTVKFLGEITETQLDAVRQNIRPVASQMIPFPLTVTGRGVFPNPHNPRILWVGTNEPVDLIRFAGSCEEACARVGIAKEERSFKAHLTIGRVQQGLDSARLRQLGDQFLSLPIGEIGHFPITELVLYRSELRPDGPVYTPIEVFPFTPT